MPQFKTVRSLFFAAVACFLTDLSLHAADGKDAKDNKNNNKPKPVAPAPVSPEREAAVLTFVRRNHDELETLLTHLKSARPREYEKAIRELSRATERLTQIHDKDADQYELELKLWKVQSRLQLLSAKVQMGAQDELKKQIKDTLKEQVEIRAAMLERQKKRLEQQTKKVGDDLDKLRSEEEQWIARQYEQLTRVANETAQADSPEEPKAAPAKEPVKETKPAPPPARKPDGKNNKPAK